MPPKILIADDDKIFVEYLCKKLQSSYQIITAHDGETALEILLTDKPDAAIMDIVMPRMTGFQVLQAYKARRAEADLVPIILISAHLNMRQFFDPQDIHSFLKKPLDLNDLQSVLDDIFSPRASATASPAGSRLGGKETRKVLAVVVAVEEYILRKLEEFFASKNYRLELAHNGDEAVLQAKKLHPDLVMAQFWENDGGVDTVKILRDLRENPATRSISFVVFCHPGLWLEAIRHFPPRQVLTYYESRDLFKQLDSFIADLEKKRADAAGQG